MTAAGLDDAHLPPSARARLGISLLVVAVVAVAALGSFRREILGRPLHAIGFQQSWDVYAPDPVHRDIRFEAHVTFADGSDTTWRVPQTAAAFAHRSHRLELWADRIVHDASSGWWDEAAGWIARLHTGDGRMPVRVVLRRRWSDLPPPGLDPRLRWWHTFDFYTLELP